LKNAKRKIRVMHVVESYEAGVEVAIKSYIENSPAHIEHCLLYGLRPFRVYEDLAVGPELLSLSLSKNPIKSYFSIRKYYRKWRPDIVHLHSSYAGFVGRLAMIPRGKILYSPHGYSFQRTDVNRFLRTGYLFIEYLLSLRCKTTVVCGLGEQKLAESLLNNKVICAPNFASITQGEKSSQDKTFDLVMAGRLTPSKDPCFFLETVKELAKKRSLNVLWIGDGDQDQVAQLKEHAVQLTGWVSSAEVINYLSGAKLYFHSAAWEGNPISVLEAAALGLPILVRDIFAFSNLPSDSKASSPQHAAQLIIDHLTGQPDRLYRIRDKVNLNNTQLKQSEALAQAYQFASGGDSGSAYYE
jgi:glycosyltransferase involved in cell wall biosynthesis